MPSPVSAPSGVRIREVDLNPSFQGYILQLPNGMLVNAGNGVANFTPKFAGLADAPASLVGLGGRPISVKADETGLEALAPLGTAAAGNTAAQLGIAVNGNNLEFTPKPIPSAYQYNTQSTNSVALSAALAEWPNSQRRQLIDLTGATQVRLIVRAVSAFAAGSKLALIYTLNGFANFSYMDGTGTGNTGAGPVASVAGANTTVNSGWVNLHANAKADVEVALASVGGDGTTTGLTIGIVTAQFR